MEYKFYTKQSYKKATAGIEEAKYSVSINQNKECSARKHINFA